jgi:hypothetical protein
MLNGLKLNSVLLIPNKSSSKISIIQPKQMCSLTHLVTPKRLCMVSKYGVSGEDLREPIHLLKKALQIDKPSRVKNKINSCSSR